MCSSPLVITKYVLCAIYVMLLDGYMYVKYM
jgi:hypothetical protein